MVRSGVESALASAFKSQSMQHLYARTMIDHKQSGNSWPSLALQAGIRTEPDLPAFLTERYWPG